MSKPNKKELSKRAKLILFYFNILIVIGGLFLIGSNIYGAVVNSNSTGVGLWAGIVITIYAGIAMYRDNPYKSTNEPTKSKSDSKQSQT